MALSAKGKAIVAAGGHIARHGQQQLDTAELIQLCAQEIAAIEAERMERIITNAQVRELLGLEV